MSFQQSPFCTDAQTGPPSKRPRISESSSLHADMNQPNNVLDSIFSGSNENSSQMGNPLPDELLSTTNQNQMGDQNNALNQNNQMQNSQLNQLLHPNSSIPNSMPNSITNSMMPNSMNGYRPQQTNVAMPMPTPSPNGMNRVTPSPSPGPASYNIRSPAPSGGPPASQPQMRVTTPNINFPNMMGQQMTQNPQFQGGGGFVTNPNQMRNNTNQHVSTMLQSVAKPTMVNQMGQGIGQQMNMNMGAGMMPVPMQNPPGMHRIVMPRATQLNYGQQMMTGIRPMTTIQRNPMGDPMVMPPMQPNQVPPQQNQISNPISNPASTTATQDPEKRKMIQNQLIILIHAAKCTKRNDVQGTQCQIPHCQTMKNVLEHLPSCQMAKNCPIQHCSSSRHIIAHWKQCKNQGCQVCQPLKHPNTSDPNRPTNPPMAHDPVPGGGPPPGGVAPVIPGVTGQTIPSIPNPSQPSTNPTSDWRFDVNSELRDHLVKKLVSAIFPGTDQNNSQNSNDDRIVRLFSFARRVEEDMYNKATTREDYYHMLAEKIYKIQKELELKRTNQPRDGVRPPQVPGQPGPPNFLGQPSNVSKPLTSPGVRWPSPNPGHNPMPNQYFGPSTPLNQPNTIQPTPTQLGTPSQHVKTEHDEEKPQIQNHNSLACFTGDTGGNFQPKQEIKNEPVDQKDVLKRDARSQSPAAPSPASKKPKEEVKDEPNDPGSVKKWGQAELKDMLLPLWRKVYEAPDAPPFQIPVDPIGLGIPDYLDVVKTPMDLSTMKNKLEDGHYTEPWRFVEDMWMMFENAWLYNKKNSRVYRMCTKLSEEFTRLADPTMRRNGFCCAKSLTYTALPLCCFGKTTCTISVGSWYYVYENDNSNSQIQLSALNGQNFSEKIYYCEKCFLDVKGDSVSTSNDPENAAMVVKTKFTKSKNDARDFEPFLNCKRCGRKNHQICVLYKKEIWKDFICDFCQNITSKRRKKNQFTAENLPETELSKFIESKVNNFITANDKSNEAGHVYIRMVFVGSKTVETRSGVRKEGETTGHEIAEKFRYRAKVLFAFEQIDGVDVCFFGLHVQEYDDKCLAPNQRRVYIGYLDSVKFFQPAYLRTNVYHELIIGYLEYCRNLGFVWAHIWSCPPSEGDDYIFHCHPQEMKMPRSKRLCDWYRAILNKAKDRQVICTYKDIFTQAKDDAVVCATQLPYFDGDFWPTAIEDLIVEVLKEQAAEAAEVDDDAGIYSDKSKSKKKNQARKNNKNKNGGDLMTKLNSLMDRHKEVFFVIRMHEEDRVPSLPSIEDPDKDMSCDLMDGRDPFLNKAKDEHWEFSTLRRTKYSSMSLLYTLHNPDNRFNTETFNCNNCEARMSTRFHCKECSDFDLCVKCNETVEHHHPLEKIVSNQSMFGVGGGDSDSMSSNEKRREGIQQCINSLVHSAKCRDANCQRLNCQKMKRVIEHSKKCPKNKQKQKTGQCHICKQFIALCCYHAKHCEEKNCRIMYCLQIKQRLRAQQESNRRRQEKLMRRRMARPELEAPQTPNPGTPGPPTPSQPGHNPGTPNANIASKGSMQTSSKHGQMQNSGKPGSVNQNQHPFSPGNPQMVNQQGVPGVQQGQIPIRNIHANPAPYAAVKAANEVVNLALQEGQGGNNRYPPQPMYQPQVPNQQPNHSQFRTSQIGYNNPTTTQSTSRGTMFIAQPNHNSPMNPSQQPPHIDNTIKMIKDSTDPKDPKVINVLKANPTHVASIFRGINNSQNPPMQPKPPVMISQPNTPQINNMGNNQGMINANMINTQMNPMNPQIINRPQQRWPQQMMNQGQMSNNMNRNIYNMNPNNMMTQMPGYQNPRMVQQTPQQNTRFPMNNVNMGNMPMGNMNNMMNNGPMMSNGMGGGMQQNMQMRQQQPSISYNQFR